LDCGVDVRFADLPQIEGATWRFLLHQMAAVAELEVGMTSTRIREALAAAKRRGVRLGGDRGNAPMNGVRKLASEAMKRRADARAADVLPAIQALQEQGAASLRAIAAGLNAQPLQSAPFLRFRHRRSKIPFDTHNDCETLAASVTYIFKAKSKRKKVLGGTNV
jgi:DNA invertase Pin-like site-specific DNA recombinase